MEKKTYEMRGKQTNIGRLTGFDREGFIHMLAYRVLIFYSVIYGLFVLAYVLINFYYHLELLTIIFWILITPQLYETAKAFSLISSRGLAFGHLSKEHVYLIKSKYSKSGTGFKLLFYAEMLLWAVGFIVLILWWNI